MEKTTTLFRFQTQRGIDIGNEGILDNTGAEANKEERKHNRFSNLRKTCNSHTSCPIIPISYNAHEQRLNEQCQTFPEIRVDLVSIKIMDNGNGGFNAGMEARDAWMPKNVDDLRVKTNPKQSFGGVILGGKRPVQNLGVHGKMEKHGVDRSWEHGPERYFTTTGAHLKNRARDNVRIGPQNRDSTMEYFGNTHNASNDQASYTKPVFRPSTKQAMEYNYKGIAHYGLGRNSKSDFGQGSYSIYLIPCSPGKWHHWTSSAWTSIVNPL